MSVECTGPLTLEPARYGTPVFYRTEFGAEPGLGDRVVGLRLPIQFAGEPQDLQVRLSVGEPRPGVIEFPMEGDGAPAATVTFGRSEAVGTSARLTVSRADNVFSGTLSLGLRHEGSTPQEASCTIVVTDVPFVPSLNSQVMWEGKGDKVQLSRLNSSGSSEGPDTWAVLLPDDVGGQLAFKLHGAPGLGTHELPTDAIHASIEGADGAKVSKAALTITQNPYGTYDADVDAVVEVAGETVRVRGMLRYMSTGAFRSARGVEARDALNVARGEPDGDSTRHPPK